jgi:hypothetical protein
MAFVTLPATAQRRLRSAVQIVGAERIAADCELHSRSLLRAALGLSIRTGTRALLLGWLDSFEREAAAARGGASHGHA